MLHPLVLTDLLADEVAVASERLGGRIAGLRHDDRYVMCPLRPAGDAPRSLVLDGRWYDAEPFRAAVCGPDGLALAADGWPHGLVHSVHPGAEPAVRVRAGNLGVALYPGHHQDRWDGAAGVAAPQRVHKRL